MSTGKLLSTHSGYNTLFSGGQDVSSDATITLNTSIAYYRFLVLVFSVSLPQTSASRGILLISPYGTSLTPFYPLVAGAKSGYARISASGSNIRIIEQTVNTTLYLTTVWGVM